MNKQKTIQILEALANGVDPSTGEVLPASGPFQDIEVNRALFNAIKLLGDSKSFSVEDIRKIYPKAYAPWSEQDDLTLEKLSAEGADINTIASALERQPSAIESRLSKLNLNQ